MLIGRNEYPRRGNTISFATFHCIPVSPFVAPDIIMNTGTWLIAYIGFQ